MRVKELGPATIAAQEGARYGTPVLRSVAPIGGEGGEEVDLRTAFCPLLTAHRLLDAALNSKLRTQNSKLPLGWLRRKTTMSKASPSKNLAAVSFEAA